MKGARSRTAATGFGIGAVGLFTGFALMDAYLSAPMTTESAAPARGQAGVELLMIFIGSSSCGASQYPGMPEAMATIRSNLEAQSQREGRLFVSVGVALDQDAQQGIGFLADFGPFDEVLSGGGWLNTGALRFVIRDFPSPRAIPQLVLIERRVNTVEGRIESVTDRVVGRKIGSRIIVEFAELLDTLQPSGS